MTGLAAWTLRGWTTMENAAIALDDRGFLQGAVIVDRLRTVDGVPLDVEQHHARFVNGCRAIGIQFPESIDLPSIVHECAERNSAHFSALDFSIVSIATPGRLSDPAELPTLIIHPMAIDWVRLSNWYQAGQRLEIATPRNVPTECWSPSIKTRARLQYYLADCASARNGVSNAGAVLLDIRGNLTETSTANILVVEAGVLISPRREYILPGISLDRTLRLAASVGLEVRFEDISASRAQAADEILLCGSTGCLWPASSLGERTFADACELSYYCRLCELWKSDLRFDFVAQAHRSAGALPAAGDINKH